MTPIVIVGAGPTGLICAIELQKRGHQVRVIDQKEGPSTHSKALALHSHTLEIFDQMDIVDHFLHVGKRVGHLTFHNQNQRFNFQLAPIDTPYPFVLIVPQSETEKILIRELELLGGKVEWQTKLVDLKRIEKDGNQSEITYSWLIGADGAHSRVRSSLKLPFKGCKLLETFLLADITTKEPHGFDAPNIFLNKQGISVIFPLPDSCKYRVIFPMREAIELENLEQRDLEELALDRGITKGLHIERVDWISKFQIQRRQSHALKVGNIFLAGDAAHIHSPMGGQGMNTSIQDGYNLCWKLDLVISERAQAKLLDTYASERLPIAKKVLRATTLATRLLLVGSWVSKFTFFIMKHLVGHKRIAKKITLGLSEIELEYPTSSLVVAGTKSAGPKVGKRAPDVQLASGRLFDYFKEGGFLVLLFKKSAEDLDHLCEKYGQSVRIVVLEENAFAKKYAAESNALYVIRPDGYIGFKSNQVKLAQLDGYFLNFLLPL